MQNLRNLVVFSCLTIFLNSILTFGHFGRLNNLFYEKLKIFSFIDSYPANVDRLNLSQDVIFFRCINNETRCSENIEKINVWTEASDPHGDLLIYHYKVSGGEITGKGEKVIWDLSNVEPGEYTIIAGVDDGCGICGQTKTRTVYVVECPKVNNENNGIPPGFISNLHLSRTEVFESCKLSKSKKKRKKSCSKEENLIKVTTTLVKPSDSKSIYKYEVTGGQIIGNGENVEWDLSKAKAGTYVITASADIGSGFCSNPVSRIIEVIECPKCKSK